MRWQLASTFAATAISAGCYGPDVHPCNNGSLCPSNLECTENPIGDRQCAPQEELEACSGKEERVPCASTTVAVGLCEARVCEPCLDPAVHECRYETWTRISTDVTNLSSIWVEAPNLAYAVGGAGVILTYDGVQWTRSELTNKPALTGVWSKGSDVFITTGSSVLRNRMPTSPNANYGLQQIWGVSSTTVFAVGNELTIGTYAGASWFWSDVNNSFTQLNDVYGIDSDRDGVLEDVIAVGDDGTVKHRPAPATTFSDFSFPNTVDDLSGVWGTKPDNFYVVGAAAGSDLAGVVHHYTASGWVKEDLPGEVQRLVAIWGTDDQSVVYAVGFAGTMVRRVNAQWELMNADAPTTANFEDIGGSGQDAYAVANDGSLFRVSPVSSPGT